ncbi:MAG: ATP-binding protein [Candidatus Bathyarchaeota archaeon]|nr:ATP-binding protein [Candidatus Bathyarchaeota archaeon]
MFKQKNVPKQVYVYEVFPVNFVTLPPDKKTDVISSFHMLLNSLPCKTRIWAILDSQNVPIGNVEVTTNFYRFFVESFGEPVDWMLEQCGFKSRPAFEVPKIEVVKRMPRWLVLKDGKHMQSFTVYALPGILWPGFLYDAFGIVDRLMIEVKPFAPEEATVKIGKYMRLLRSMMLADQQKGRMLRDEIKMRHDMAAATYQALASGVTRLFDISINLSVIGSDREEMRSKAKRLRDMMHARLVKLDCPSYVQYDVAVGAVAKHLIVDTSTAGTMFPFVSADLIESSGIFLGINRYTGAPVMLDPWLRMNYNMLIVGQSGSGKSFSSKLMITRLALKNKDLAFFIIDPENEYRAVGKALGAEIVDVTTEGELGLDPVQIFSGNKDTAASIIADIAGIDDRRSYDTLRTIVGKSRDLLEVYQESPDNLKDYLHPLIEGPDSFLVNGEPQNFTNRMVFNLSPLHAQIAPVQHRSLAFQAANILLFSKIWQMLDTAQFIPVHIPKLVVIDELWLYTSSAASASFLEGVSRRGRKRNILFLLNSQRIGDVLESQSGKAIIENCATKILLRQDESAIRLVSGAVGLSPQETEMLLEAKPGNGLLIAEDNRVILNFMATQDEYTLFTTKPTERIV